MDIIKIFSIPWFFLYAYLFVMNISGIIIMGVDKRRALRKRWRTPEKTMFITALLGGALGVFLGMRIFHHKTLHNKFKYGIPALLLLNAAIVVLIVK